MKVIDAYIKEMIDTIKRIEPNIDKEELERIVRQSILTRVKNPSADVDNNVTGDHEDIDLIKLCNWIEKTKPIISGNATFYQQPEVLRSPTSNMLKDLKRSRKQVKKEMFDAMKRGDMDRYRFLDLVQLNIKIIMNAEYGASGAPVAAFYNKYLPASTTLMAQSIITTMAAFFEGYVGDNQVFFHLNECMDWMNTVIKKKESIHKWVRVPSPEEVERRIKKHFMLYNFDDNYVIDNYIRNRSDRELVYLYYANNMKEFISDHSDIQYLLSSILSKLPLYEASPDVVPAMFASQFEDVEKYNSWVSSEMFLNPYKVPKVIEDDMNKLRGMMNQYCFVKYLTPDSIVRLNNHKRNTILLVDTDSNVINSDLFIRFILNDVLSGETFQRSKLYNEMICVNILANILDEGVANILDFYGRCHNIGKEGRAELSMKNEFMFRRFFLMTTKKRYVTSIALREGNIMMPFKTEIKGLDFIKAGVTDEVTDKFTKILEDNILFIDEPNLHGLMRDLKNFEKEIYQDLRAGGTRFLKQQQYKNEDAYGRNNKSDDSARSVWSLPVFRAASVWNEIYPYDRIYGLERVKIVKLTITCLEDIEPMKKDFPDMYETLSKKIFLSGRSELEKAGLKVIGVPAQLSKMPEWIIKYIDYSTTISDIIGSFRSVLEALRIEEVTIKTPNNKANLVTSLKSI